MKKYLQAVEHLIQEKTKYGKRANDIIIIKRKGATRSVEYTIETLPGDGVEGRVIDALLARHYQVSVTYDTEKDEVTSSYIP